jgi:hypothetical protein
MRAMLTILSLAMIALAVFLAVHSGSRRSTAGGHSPLATATKHDFDKEIKPIFQARCQPCHFQGGQVYEKLPFDKPTTITKLGTKLFTRIKDEKDQKLIREFLAEN